MVQELSSSTPQTVHCREARNLPQTELVNQPGQTPPGGLDCRADIRRGALEPSICRSSNLEADQQEKHLARRPHSGYLAIAREPKAMVHREQIRNLLESLGCKEASRALVDVSQVSPSVWRYGPAPMIMTRKVLPASPILRSNRTERLQILEAMSASLNESGWACTPRPDDHNKGQA